jgi:RNA polymerase sigma-70 factor (ECF subfamily)
MDTGQPRFEADRREHEEPHAAALPRLRKGDLGGLAALLAADVRLVADSGGDGALWARAASWEPKR